MTPGEIEYYAERDRRIRRLARTPRCDLALRYLSIEKSTGIEGAHWQPFQIEWLNDTSSFASMNKSRQIGASFIVACDELVDGMLKGNHTVIATSYNLEEAKEKIVYAKAWWESRHENPQDIPAFGEFDNHGNWLGPSPYRIAKYPELVTDNALALEWDNGFRFISHPCRPPRGKRASVVLDEFGHYMHARQIYTAALPMITRGMGGRNRIRVLSTPLGASGEFHDIHTNALKYQHYVRYDYGWWEIEDLCEAGRRLECIQAWKDGMPPEQMVRTFGTAQLKVLFEGLELEDFLQEYHLQFLDSAHAFLTYDLIRSCYPAYWNTDADFGDEDDIALPNVSEYDAQYIGYRVVADGVTKKVLLRNDDLIDDVIVAIRRLADDVRQGRIGDCLVWGFDVGRDRDASEITVLEVKDGRHYQRLMITMRQIPFELQKKVLGYLLSTLPIYRGYVDKGGPGRDLAEFCEESYGEDRCTGIWFDNQKKELWALNLKKTMERSNIVLIPDRDQESQLHSIQRRVTTAKHMIYEITDNKSNVGGGKVVRHHADKFWSLALANWAGIGMVLSYSPSGATVPPPPGMPTAKQMSDGIAAKGHTPVRLRSRAAGDVVREKMMSGMR